MEYLFSRRQILIVLAIFTAYFAYMAYRIDSPRVFVIMTSIMLGLSMPFISLGREDKFKTAGLVCSLPVRRSTVVLGKYVASWTATVFGLGYALLFTAVFPLSKFSASEILSARTLLVSLFLISLIFSVILPFTLRFGLTGVIILLVGLQLLGVVAFALAQFAGRARNPMRIVVRAIEGGLRVLLHHKLTPGFLLALLAAFVALNAVSILVGRALYLRREL